MRTKKMKNASFAISDSEGWLCSVVLQCLKSSANIIQPQRKCASFLDLICFLKSILDLGTLVKIFDISWMLPTLLKLMTKARATWQQPHGPSIMICKPQWYKPIWCKFNWFGLGIHEVGTKMLLVHKDIWCWLPVGQSTKWRCLVVRRQDGTWTWLFMTWYHRTSHDLSDVWGKLRPIHHQKRNTELGFQICLIYVPQDQLSKQLVWLESLEMMPSSSKTPWCWWRYWGLDLLCFSIAVCLSRYATVLLCDF